MADTGASAGLLALLWVLAFVASTCFVALKWGDEINDCLTEYRAFNASRSWIEYAVCHDYASQTHPRLRRAKGWSIMQFFFEFVLLIPCALYGGAMAGVASVVSMMAAAVVACSAPTSPCHFKSYYGLSLVGTVLRIVAVCLISTEINSMPNWAHCQPKGECWLCSKVGGQVEQYCFENGDCFVYTLCYEQKPGCDAGCDGACLCLSPDAPRTITAPDFAGNKDAQGQGKSTGAPECADISVYADGRCDEANNKGACHYDGGDCCDATCQPTLLHSCPRNSFHCVDPDVYSCSHPMWSGDGWCDIENNTPACLWDGGDCCEDTCNNDHATFECGQNGYKCRDPDSEDHGSTDTTGDGGVEQLDCAYPEWYADGFCDSGPSIIGWHGNNVKSCNYDGGDCCASTCESAKHTCGQGGYDCVNPDAGQGKGASGCQYPEWKGNGRCDPWNNEASCQWDGGDCCPNTCNQNTAPTQYMCGTAGYDCRDPWDPGSANSTASSTGVYEPMGHEEVCFHTDKLYFYSRRFHRGELYAAYKTFGAKDECEAYWRDKKYDIWHATYYNLLVAMVLCIPMLLTSCSGVILGWGAGNVPRKHYPDLGEYPNGIPSGTRRRVAEPSPVVPRYGGERDQDDEFGSDDDSQDAYEVEMARGRRHDGKPRWTRGAFSDDSADEAGHQKPHGGGRATASTTTTGASSTAASEQRVGLMQADDDSDGDGGSLVSEPLADAPAATTGNLLDLDNTAAAEDSDAAYFTTAPGGRRQRHVGFADESDDESSDDGERVSLVA